jgi:hypothetical protein
MTDTPPTTTGTPAPSRGPRWRNLQTVLALLALLVLLAPVLYLFTKLWSATGASVATTTTERAAVSYARPIDKVLAALADAEYTAAGGSTVDPTDLRAAIDEVNVVDRRMGDPLQVRQRWIQVVHEIDGAIGQNANGADALRAYAAPISLTQALLDRIARLSGAAQDPGPGSYQLTQVALHSLPDVLVNAARVSSLAAVTEAPTKPRPVADPRLAVAGDRLAQAASEVSSGLRTGSDPGSSFAVDLDLLGPLDEFVAAADDLSQLAAGLDVAGSGARDRIDAANTLVTAKALALQTAVLDAFNGRLAAHGDDFAGQRRILILLAAIIVLATAALVWLGLRGPAAAKATVPDAPAESGAEGQRLFPPRPDDIGPDNLPRMPDLVDARDLFSAPLAPTRPRGTGQEVAGPR